MTASTFSAAEIACHRSCNSCWIVRNGRVYDVTSFLVDHPGGAESILEYTGQDVSAVMKDASEHEHSEAAYELLESYFIGFQEEDGSNSKVRSSKQGVDQKASPALSSEKLLKTNGNPKSNLEKLDDQICEEFITARKPFLDLSKPLLYQMWTSRFSKETYLKQVHIPKHLPDPAYIFANPYLEIFTRTPWYVVPLVWLPVSFYCLSVGLAFINPLVVAAFYLTGLMIWTFCEYIFHRFLFHLDEFLPDHPAALTFHFLIHGIHHHLPMDRLRLVMPPVMFAALLILPWCFFRYFLAFDYACSLLSGALQGYVIYDMIHYFLHHGKPFADHLREMKSYHLDHHYKNYELGYGITSKFWDRVFGTLLPNYQ